MIACAVYWWMMLMLECRRCKRGSYLVHSLDHRHRCALWLSSVLVALWLSSVLSGGKGSCCRLLLQSGGRCTARGWVLIGYRFATRSCCVLIGYTLTTRSRCVLIGLVGSWSNVHQPVMVLQRFTRRMRQRRNIQEAGEQPALAGSPTTLI